MIAADIFARHAALVASGLPPRDASLAMLPTEVREFYRLFGIQLTPKKARRIVRRMLATNPMPGGPS